jgi:outer membrane protein TolC
MTHHPDRRTRTIPTPAAPARRLTATLALLTLGSFGLGGCASLSPDGGLGPVSERVRQHAGQPVALAASDGDLDAIKRRVDELLARPLDADAAVQLALLNHRGLQADLAALGIADAQRVRASRLPNPGFSFGRSQRGSEREIERGVHLNLARLIALPAIAEVEQRRFASMQQRVAMQAIDHAAATRKAWVEAVAAEETVRYRRQVVQAAEAGAELARRMEQVGNFNKLQRAREQGFHADALLDLARAEQQQRARRERLIRVLGLWGDQTERLRLPERLPELPPALAERPSIEREALAQRLDVQAARLDAEQTARNLGLTRTTRFVNVLELGAKRVSSNEEPTETGWEVSVELPLFDWAGSRVAEAEAIYRQSMHRAAAVAIDARSQVREAWSNLRFAWDIARHHRDELVPLKRRISEENLLRYNGMLIGVFDLLADARSQIAGVNAAIDALRDYWLAAADLELAMVGQPALAPMAPATGGAPAAAADPH